MEGSEKGRGGKEEGGEGFRGKLEHLAQTLVRDEDGRCKLVILRPDDGTESSRGESFGT